MEGSSDEDVASECTRYEEECADEAPPNHPGLSGTEISSTLLFCGFCCSRLCWEFFFTGSSSSIHMLSLESVSQLGNEIRILLAQKENLQTELKHLSQDEIETESSSVRWDLNSDLHDPEIQLSTHQVTQLPQM
ncbi:uncharacterized protein [Notamacropus eugenii]|uniref:uncharacterized protein isoform X4 n=1 Tax=Notamacropus eugenii TaxID=9315 RepID=UPI003B681BD4